VKVISDQFIPDIWRSFFTCLERNSSFQVWSLFCMGRIGKHGKHKFPQIRKTTCQDLGIWGSATEVSLGSLYAGAVTKAGGLLMWGSFA
jgi:hypothetical protein